MLQLTCTLEHNNRKKFLLLFGPFGRCRTNAVFSFIIIWLSWREKKEQNHLAYALRRHSLLLLFIFAWRVRSMYCTDVFVFVCYRFRCQTPKPRPNSQYKHRLINNYDNCNYLLRIDCGQLFWVLSRLCAWIWFSVFDVFYG